MSRYANVSLLSAGNISRPYTDNHDELIRAYTDRWDAEFAKVLPARPDLIVMPEVSTTYFCHTAEQRFAFLKSATGPFLEHFRRRAKEYHCYIAYSAERYFPEDEKYPSRNSTMLIDREGNLAGIYDKNYVTIRANEVNASGYCDRAEVIETEFGRVACAICFDLNFDELMFKYAAQHPDLILFSSMYHGGLSQVNWAYTCHAHFASAVCNAQSRMLSPMGVELFSTTNYYNYVTGRINTDCVIAHIDHNNARFLAAKKKYGDSLIRFDPGYVGSVLLTCERDDMTVMDIVKEFEIELMDDYFARSLDHRHRNMEK